MEFAVVEFCDDMSVEVVRHNWVVGDSCYWPPYRGLRFTAAVRKGEAPNDNWLKYRIRIIGTYGTYEAARNKLPLAEDTSTLETDVEDIQASRRRRRKVFSDFDENGVIVDGNLSKTKEVHPKAKLVHRHGLQTQDNLPKPPAELQGLFGTSNQGLRRSPRKVVLAGSGNPGASAPSEAHTLSQTMTPGLNSADVTSNSPIRYVETSCGIDVIQSTPNHRPVTSPQCSEGRVSTLEHQGSGSGVDTSSYMTRLGSVVKFPAASSSGQLKLILARLGVIEQCQRHQSEISQQILHCLQQREEVYDLPDCLKDKIPVQSLLQLSFVEDKLEDKDTLRKLSRHLGSIGGKDVAETVRNVLKSLMNNSVAAQMNFMGRGGKTAIKNMKLLHVIIGAVRRNKRLKAVSKVEIETVIKLWLRYARDRSGGRQVRAKSKREEQEISDAESDGTDLAELS